MNLFWLTDLHLNFVGRNSVEDLCRIIRSLDADAVLITGDIVTSSYICPYLTFLAANIQKKIYFVLGNHDYYHASIRSVNAQVANIVKESEYLVWLSRSDVIELSYDTCIIGHEGLADGRLGDPLGSPVDLNDYHIIEELRQPSKERRLKVQNKLGDSAAWHLENNLNKAIGRYKNILVALHVPPFLEACWHLGQNTDDNFLPHFACQATGDILKAAMVLHPDTMMTVYCGHTHSGGYAEILPNLQVFTAGAEYGRPGIADIIQI